MNTSKTRHLIAVALVALVNAPAHADQVMTIGAGVNASCGTWLERRKEDRHFDLSNWALGYISGAATYGTIGNPLGQTDAYGVLYWLDNYCRGNPSSYFADGVKVFIKTH